jgi:hypothetical protein
MKNKVPDIGSIVIYGLDSFGEKPQTWRVDSWMRIAPVPKFSNPPTNVNDMIDQVLFEGCQKIKGHRMQWCLQHEATHLGLSGVCGRIAPIEECEVIGIVEWSKKDIEEAKQSAIRLGEVHEMLF